MGEGNPFQVVCHIRREVRKNLAWLQAQNENERCLQLHEQTKCALLYSAALHNPVF
jgi:hypothetical protein